MLRLSILLLAIGAISAAPRMVVKIRPVAGRSLDVATVNNLTYAHIDVDDPEVKTMAEFAATALSFAAIKSNEPLALVNVTSALRRNDSDIMTSYKLTLVIRGDDEDHYYYCNAAVSEQMTNWTNSSSHREVHLVQPSKCIQGTKELVLESKEAPAALFAAAELSQSVLVLNASLTLLQVTEWMPPEKNVGTEYKMDLVFVNEDNKELHCLTVVNDRLSHNDKQMAKVDCSPAVSTKSNTSGVKDDPEVAEMADFVTSFLKESRNMSLSLLRVDSVEKIRFEGVQIRPSLKLRVADKKEHFYYCNAAVFLDGLTGDYELIRSQTTCSDTPPNSGNVPAATAEEKIQPPGAYEDVPIDDPQVRQLAAFATSALAHSMNSGEQLELVTIESAQRQIVAGTNHRLHLDLMGSNGEVLIFCMVVVFDQPWTNTRELSEASCRPGTKKTPIFEDVPVDDRIVRMMAEFSTGAIAERMNTGDLVLVNIIAAQRHVADGTANHRLELELVSPSGESEPLHCAVEVFDEPSTRRRELTQISCRPTTILPAPIKDSPSEAITELGSFHDVPVDDDDVEQMAAFATSVLSRSINAGNLFLVNIESAERQMVVQGQDVMGTNHRFMLELESSTGDSLQCLVVLFDQPWTGTRDLSQVNCRPGAL